MEEPGAAGGAAGRGADPGTELRAARELLDGLGPGFALTAEDRACLRAARAALGELERVLAASGPPGARGASGAAARGAAGPQALQAAKVDLVSLAVTTRELRQARAVYQGRPERQDEAVGSFIQACLALERAAGELAGGLTRFLGQAAVARPDAPQGYNFLGLALFAAVVLVALVAAFGGGGGRRGL